MAVIQAIKTFYLEADTAVVEFTGIPSTYKHLQLRFSGRSGDSGTGHVIIYMQFGTGGGAADTGSNYSVHYLRGYNGGHGVSVKTANGTNISAARIPQEGEDFHCYGISIVDILDYTNTNKNTTCQFQCWSAKASGEVGFGSGGWFGGSQGAVDRIKLTMADSWVRGSEFSLYGLGSAN